MLLQHSKRSVHAGEVEHNHTDLYDVSVHLVGRKDDLGYIFKILCSFIKNPVHKRRRPMKTTSPQAKYPPP